MTTKGVSKIYAEALQSMIKQIEKPTMQEVLEESAKLAGLEEKLWDAVPNLDSETL